MADRNPQDYFDCTDPDRKLVRMPSPALEYKHGRGPSTPPRDNLSLEAATPGGRKGGPTGLAGGRHVDTVPGRILPDVQEFLDAMEQELGRLRRRQRPPPRQSACRHPRHGCSLARPAN